MGQVRKKKAVPKKSPAKKIASAVKKKKVIARRTPKKPTTTVAHSKTKKLPEKQKKLAPRNEKSFSVFTDPQKIELLDIIGKIVQLHYANKDGLKSLAGIERILDPYNQKYAHPGTKFDAIIKHGIAGNPAILHEHIYVFVQATDKDITDFYTCLSQMGTSKMTFTQAKLKLEKIYHTAFEKRYHIGRE